MAVEVPVIVNIADGIDDAIKNQLPKAMRNMQVAMSRNSLGLKFHIDDSNLAKVETILMDTTLKANQLARALQEVNAEISKKKAGGAKFTGNNVSIKNRALLEAQTALQMKYNALAWAEQHASKEAKDLADSQDRVDRSNKKVSNSTQEVNKNLKNTSNHIANIIKNSIRLIAVHAATRFIRNVREVTAEFEMQRVALAGILQDSAEAESLFKRLKAAAIKSPFEIKDLVRFTKQLSAYRVETDKLFDVTTRLADVSAGLGVDMSRLVLAYGQVRAASVLRGQELRQFTEAGIPLVDLLSKKFSDLNGRLVSTAEVFELISKRAVPFKMIEEIFNDMTSAGGTFYKMQEKQSETLKGQFMKLKDALSIMYDEIGNTESVHKAMEDMMSMALRLMQSWRKVSGVVKGLGVALAINQLLSLIPGFTQKTTLAKKAVEGLATSFKSVGTWVGLAISVISAVIGYVIQLRKEANRLNKEIEAARVKGDIQIEQSLRNFKRLADAAVSAVQGSSEQREAIKELQRTYGDIIPSQDLEIEKLRELKGNYESVTRAISEKIQMQIHEQNVNQIQDTYGNMLATEQKNLKDYIMKNAGLSAEEAGRVISGILKAVKENAIDLDTPYEELFDVIKRIAEEQVGLDVAFQTAASVLSASSPFNRSYLRSIIKYTGELNDKLDDENAYFKGLNNSMGVYSDTLKKLRENASRLPEGFTLEDVGSFEYNQALWKQRMEDYKNTLIDVFKGVDISDAFETAGTINFEKLFAHVTSGEGTATLKKFVNEIQKDYLNFAPQENTTRLVTEAALGFADAVGIAMTRVQGYLKKDGQKMDEYAKSVEDFVKAQKLRVQTKEFEYKNWSLQADWVRPTEEDIQNEKDELTFLEKLLAFVQEFLKQKNTGGSGRDPWIILYKNRMKFMQDFQKGVEDLDKYLSHSVSLGREQGIMKGRGLSLGIDTAQLAGDAEELRKWYSDAIDDVVKKIQTMGGKQFAGLGVTEILAKDLSGRKIQKYQELLQELWKGLTDFDTNQLKKDIDEELKRISDEIKRSETARDFYKNILDLTGDEDLATSMSVSVYGDIGKEFKDRMQQQLDAAFQSLDWTELPDDIWGQLAVAVSNQDFNTILEKLDLFPKEWQEILKQMASDAAKYNADIANNFANLVSKYGSTAQKIATITAKADNEIKKVTAGRDLALKAKNLTPEQIQGINERADELIRALEAQRDLDIFKAGEDYIKFFAEINVMTAEQATTVRTKLRAAYLKAFHDGAITADELHKNLRAIDTQFRKLTEDTGLLGAYLSGGFDKANEKLMEYSDNISILAEKMKAGKTLDADEQNFVSQMLRQFGSSEGLKGIKSYTQLIENKGGLEAAGEAFGAMGEGMSAAAANGPGALAIVDAIFKAVHGTITGIQQIIDQLNEVRSEENKIGDWFKYVSDFDRYTYSGWEKLKSGDAIGATADAVSSWISIFNNIQRDKVKKFDDEIERQSRLLSELGYAYGRLQQAESKALGAEFIANYGSRLSNLQAQVDAYNAQAAAEQAKGKSADSEKVKQFQDSAREALDQIEDMQSEVSNKLLGTDLTSAARDFANAWIEAYKSFGSTTDALKEKFADMIQSMVVESLAARVVQEQLAPIFEMIDKLSEDDGQFSVMDAAAVANKTKETVGTLNVGLTNLMNALSGAGLNIRSMGTGLTGISKDIQGASEESILGLAAGVNTQNYYMSQINANVIRIVSILGGEGASGAASGTSPASGMSAYQTEALSYLGHLPQMQSDMAEVRRLLSEVIKVKGASSTYSVRIS